MVKAGALYYAIFVAFIVSFICGFFILTTYFFRGFLDTQIIKDQMSRNVYSGINLVMADPGTVSINETLEYDLFGEGKDIVTIEKRKWGVYDILYVSAHWRQFIKQKTALIGEDLFKDEPIALYLTDKSKYISVSGDTRIKGNAYLPKLGIKRAHIEGQSYTGEKIVFGKIKNSADKLPTIIQDLVKENNKVFNRDNSLSATIQKFDQYPDRGFIANSFLQPSLILYSEDDLVLTKITITGNVILLVDDLVEIYPDARLIDVIIYAKRVGIADGVIGNFQIFAKDTILVGEKVHLEFPSCLAVLNDDLNPGYVCVGNGSRISGGLIMYNLEETAKESELMIEQGAIIVGQVYCAGMVEHKGRINGSLYCNGFKLKTKTAYYENHLLNAQICFMDLSQYFVGFPLLENNRGKLIKWLN